MKQILLLTICLLGANFVHAETISGEVTGVRKNTITIRAEDGEKMTLHTTDNTSYREKKVARKGKKHKGKMHSAETYYRPMVEEDDWVDIIYSPSTGDMLIIEDVIVYDD